MKEEYENIKSKVETYIHKRYLLTNEEGHVVMIRASFSNTKFFLRSASIIVPDIDLMGKPCFRYSPLKTMNSIKESEMICEPVKEEL